jgi:predicted DNA-binding transcriptional regulator AlpA
MEKQGYREALELLVSYFPDRVGISVKEASQFFGKSVDAIYDAIKSKKHPLPAVKMGGSLVLSITQLARWMC